MHKVKEIDRINTNLSISETIHQCDLMLIYLEQEKIPDALKTGRLLKDQLTFLKCNKNVFTSSDLESSFVKLYTKFSMNNDTLIRVHALGAIYDKPSIIINVQDVRQALIEISLHLKKASYEI